MPLIVCKDFPPPHFTTTKQLGNMKDPSIRNDFLISKNINPQNLVLARQTHSAAVLPVLAKDGGKILDGCDGFITDDKNLMLGIFTADCMPVLFASKDGRVKAASHAGWRGLADGILENTVDAFFQKYGIPYNGIEVYIAPHIRKCCYEVSEDFERIFNTKLIDKKLDLSAIAKQKLKARGIENIHISGLCVCCNKDLFFSHRRDNKCSDRLLTVI